VAEENNNWKKQGEELASEALGSPGRNLERHNGGKRKTLSGNRRGKLGGFKKKRAR